MNGRSLKWLVLTAAVTLFQSPMAYAGVVNGDFSDTTVPVFTGWTTDTSDGFTVAPSDDSSRARFDTFDFSSDLVQLEQTFTLDSGSSTLSFEFSMTSVSDPIQPDLGFGFDVFQAILFDSSGDPINAIDSTPDPFGDPLDPRFYGFDAGGNPFLPATGVTVDNFLVGTEAWKRINLDVSSFSGQSVTLEFTLLGDDDELATTVWLDNVRVTTSDVIPEPTSIAVWALLGAAALPGVRRRRRTVAS